MPVALGTAGDAWRRRLTSRGGERSRRPNLSLLLGHESGLTTLLFGERVDRNAAILSHLLQIHELLKLTSAALLLPDELEDLESELVVGHPRSPR